MLLAILFGLVVVVALLVAVTRSDDAGPYVEPQPQLPPLRVDVDEVRSLSETGVRRLVDRAKESSRFWTPGDQDVDA